MAEFYVVEYDRRHPMILQEGKGRPITYSTPSSKGEKPAYTGQTIVNVESISQEVRPRAGNVLTAQGQAMIDGRSCAVTLVVYKKYASCIMTITPPGEPQKS